MASENWELIYWVGEIGSRGVESPRESKVYSALGFDRSVVGLRDCGARSLAHKFGSFRLPRCDTTQIDQTSFNLC